MSVAAPNAFGAAVSEKVCDAHRAPLEHSAESLMRSLRECRLYGIIDLGYIDRRECSRIADKMIQGGVDLIQLRGKTNSFDELVDLAAQLHEPGRALLPQ